LGHRAPARLGLRNRRFLLFLPPGAFKERRVGRALRKRSASGRCRHRRADIGAGDRRCEAPRSAGGSWTSKDAQRIEEAEKSALQARPGRKQGGGGGACYLGLEAVTVTVVGTWKARKHGVNANPFLLLSSLMRYHRLWVARAIRCHVSGG
jgi:hypothetical protein